MDGNEVCRLIFLFAATHHLEITIASFSAEYVVSTQNVWAAPLLVGATVACAKLMSNFYANAVAIFGACILAKSIWVHSLFALVVANVALVGINRFWVSGPVLPSTCKPHPETTDDVNNDKTCLYLF